MTRPARGLLAAVGVVAVCLAALYAGERPLLRAALDGAGLSSVGLEGSLFGTVRVETLQGSTPGAELRLHDVALELSLPSLLLGELRIARLQIASVEAELSDAQADDETAELVLPTAPLPIRIDELTIERFATTGTVVLTGRVESAVGWHRTLAIDALDLTLRNHPLADRLGELRIRGELDLQDAQRANAELALHTQRSPTLGAALHGRLSLAADASVRALDARLERPLALEVRGRQTLSSGALEASLTLADAVAIEATTDASEHWTLVEGAADARLRAPVAGELSGLSISLRAATGDLSRLTLDADVSGSLADPLRDGRPTPVTLHGEARADAERIEVAALTLTTPGLRVSAPTHWRHLTRELSTTLAIEVDDTRAWLPKRSAQLSGGADLALRVGEDGALEQFTITDLELVGNLEGSPLQARGNARLSADAARIAGALTAKVGKNALALDGEVGLPDRDSEGLPRDFDLDGELDLDDLAQLGASLAGSAAVRFTAHGTPTAPLLSGTATAQAVDVGDVHVATLTAELRTIDDADAPLEVVMNTRLGTSPEHTPLAATLSFTGDLERARVQLNASIDDGALPIPGAGSVEIAGALERASEFLAVTIDTMNLALPELTQLTLRAPADLRVERAPAAVSHSQLCLDGDPMHLCVAAHERRVRWQPSVTATAVPMALLDALLPPGVTVAGTMDARMDVGDDGWDLGASSASTTFIVDREDDARGFEGRLRQFEFTLRQSPERLRGHLLLAGSRLGRIDAGLDFLGTGPLGERQLDGRLDLAVDSLAALDALVPDLEQVDGSLRAGITVSGTMDAPRLQGDASAEASVEAPALGRTIVLRSLQVEAQAGAPVALAAELAFDEAVVSAAGTLDLSAQTAPRLELSIDATSPAQIVALPDLALWIQPTLTLSATRDRLDVEGRIYVPRARVRVDALPATGSAASPDVVIHGPADQGSTSRQLVAAFGVDLGDDVLLTAGSLRTRLVGSLDLDVRPGQPILARGRVETRDGVIERFGRELVLQQGRLAFDGPVTRPLIDATATRSLPGYRVGLTLSGLPNALTTSIYSSPAVDDVTAMTMLVTGRQPAEASGAELNRVRSAAVGLGIGAANPVLQGLGERLGLTELGLDGDIGTDSGAVVAGRRVSDRLYARYNYALESGASGVSLEYQISDTLSARTSSGAVHALDLLYRRDFD